MIHARPNETKRDFVARAVADEDMQTLLDTPAKREAFAGAIWVQNNGKKATGKEWYRITAQEDHAEILLYDEIGDGFFGGISARSFAEELRELRNLREINIRINSPGGDVFEGLAMYNSLKRHPARIVVDIDGFAASIASVIALAGDEVHMAQNAFFMIHNPMGVAVGTAVDMQLMAEALGKIQGSLVDIYETHSRLSASRTQEFMDQETWFTASEALSHNLIDEVTEGQQIAARFNFSQFHHVPEQAQALAAGRQRSVVAPQGMLKHMREQTTP